MAEKDLKTVTNEQIVTERKFPRRSFLTATGALLAGAVAIASGVRASAQDAQQASDPDSKKKAADPDTKDKPKKAKASSKTAKKATDPDKKKKTTAKPKTPPKTDPDGSRV